VRPCVLGIPGLHRTAGGGLRLLTLYVIVLSGDLLDTDSGESVLWEPLVGKKMTSPSRTGTGPMSSDRTVKEANQLGLGRRSPGSGVHYG
jgi:hypothetical protein